MSAPFQVADWHVYTVFGFVLVLGFMHLARQLRNLSNDYKFVNDFREKFIAYCNSEGQDHAAYNWLMRNSNRMQMDMGGYGVYSSYKPPFANHVYKNYPIILNMLPELRSYIERDLGGSLNPETILGFMRVIEEALLRYIGVVEERLPLLRRQLLNPFLCLREGVGQVISVPLLLLSQFGLMGAATLGGIQANGIFKALSALGGLIGIIGGGMTIMLGWGESIQLLKGFVDAF